MPQFHPTLSPFSLLLCAGLAQGLWAQGADDFPDRNVDLVAHVDFTEGNGERGNDVWGYVGADGTEYAVVGSTAGTYVYSLAEPTTPALAAMIPGSRSIWRDIKSYGDYVYVVADEGSDGVLVIDMSGAPNEITSEFYRPRIAEFGDAQVLTNHNLYISAEGVLVLCGGNVGRGRPLLFDLTASPTEPPYLGAARGVYAHDVHAEQGTLLSSDIFTGELTVHSYDAEGGVQALGTVTTPNRFTHNAWPNAEGTVAFTTDERSGAFVAAYDVSDPTDIRELDRFRPDATLNSGSIPHNTHYLPDGYLVTSWYRDGVIITDAARPGNLVDVGSYDTYAGGGDGFQGDWGAYPYLPSGLILLSDIERGLFVLRPDYQRGCYFEGQVVDDRTGQPVTAASVDFDGRRAQSTGVDLGGDFAVGILEEGAYPVVVSAPGYLPRGFEVDLARGELVERVVRLESLVDAQVTVTITDLEGTILPEADFALLYRGQAGGGGAGERLRYDLVGGAWGYRTTVVEDVEIVVGEPTELTVALPRGIYDDFTFDAGWTLTSRSAAGNWERAVPVGTRADGLQVQPDQDVDFDFGGFAYVTGATAGRADVGDVDGGTTALTSPVFDGRELAAGRVQFYYDYFVGGAPQLDDSLFVEITNGTDSVKVLVADTTTGGYQLFPSEPLGELLTPSATMRVRLIAADRGVANLVEATIDAFTIISEVTRPNLNLAAATGCLPLEVELSATDQTLPEDTRWTFTGAVEPDFRGPTGRATYLQPGSFDVAISIAGADGGVATFVYSDLVTAVADPVADLAIERVGDTVFFFNESPGGQEVLWDFGDGSTSDEPFATHFYDTPGTYLAVVTVSNLCGSATDSVSIQVDAPSSTRDAGRGGGLQLLGNPVGDVLAFRVESARVASVPVAHVFDVAGARVAERSLGDGPSYEIDVAELPAGLYFLSVGGATERFVVAR